jgi:hypothetical protein
MDKFDISPLLHPCTILWVIFKKVVIVTCTKFDLRGSWSSIFLVVNFHYLKKKWQGKLGNYKCVFKKKKKKKSSKKSEASFSYRCKNRTWPLGDVSMRSFQCKTCIIDIWVQAKNYVLIIEPWWIESRDGSPMILKPYLLSGVGYHLATKKQCHVHIHVPIWYFLVELHKWLRRW